jgi:hypothetical protein
LINLLKWLLELGEILIFIDCFIIKGIRNDRDEELHGARHVGKRCGASISSTGTTTHSETLGTQSFGGISKTSLHMHD